MGESEKPDHAEGKLVSRLDALAGEVGIGGGGASHVGERGVVADRSNGRTPILPARADRYSLSGRDVAPPRGCDQEGKCVQDRHEHEEEAIAADQGDVLERPAEYRS